MSPLFSRFANRAAGALDGLLLASLRRRAGRDVPRPLAEGGPTSTPSRFQLLEEATAFYRQPEILSGAQFFLEPPPLRITERPVRRLDGGEVVDLTFPSRFEPRWEKMRQGWLSHVENRTAHVRLFRHPTPRPAVVYLHGWAAGSYFVEERTFAARWLHKLGLDVSLFVLPFHAKRAAPDRRRSPLWPTPHVARANEGFAQAMLDLRGYIRWLRERGAPSVSVCGISMGGYTTALLGTIEPIDAAWMMIPVASLPDLFWWHGEGSPERAAAEREGITLERMRAAFEVVSPLRRTPLLDGERVLIVDAEGDRIAPRQHAGWLAEHFRARRLTLAGGHIVQPRRGDAFRALARHLAALAILPPRA